MLTCELLGINPTSVTGQIITGPEMGSHNAFDNPDAVAPQIFDGAKISAGNIVLKVPAKSVVVLEII